MDRPAQAAGALRGGDAVLYLTHDLLGEYLRLEENNKRRAVKEKLGRGDQLSGFLQWVGTYCGYISFLTAEYIKLRSNVYRIAALLLGIKEACASTWKRCSGVCGRKRAGTRKAAQA